MADRMAQSGGKRTFTRFLRELSGCYVIADTAVREFATTARAERQAESTARTESAEFGFS